MQTDSNPSEATCEIKQVSQGRRPHLSIDIPPRSGTTNIARANVLTPPSSSLSRGGSGLPPRPASTKIQRSRSSIKKLLSATSFKFAGDAVTDVRNDLLGSDGLSRGNRERSSIIRSLSLTKLLSPSVRRATSLPVDSEVDLSEKSLHEATTSEGTSNAVSIIIFFSRKSKIKPMCNQIVILSLLKLTEKRCTEKNMAVKVGSFKW
jgi:hypothetical protein